MKRANIKNVAEAAGVSLATVSRVLNGTANVSEEKVQCVFRAATGLGYPVPQRSISQQVRFRTRNIALVYAGWSSMQIAEWGFMEGIEEVFRKHDLRLVLTSLSKDGPAPSLLSDESCDGVIVLADVAGVSSSTYECIRNFPCIQIVRTDEQRCFGDEAICDNASVARMAADFLHQQGVKRFGFFNIYPDHEACRERGDFFQFYLQRMGLSATRLVADEQDALTRPRHQLAEVLAEQYLSLAEKPDGMFVPVDFQLPEVYSALQARGIRPMQDVKIISCDNCERHLARVSPRPVTIDQRLHYLGYHAARQLIWRIQHPDSPPVRLFIKPELILP